MFMPYTTLIVEKEGRHARLTLNRPASMNAMDGMMMKELADVFESFKKDESVQVITIKGAGRAFSAGGDIKAMLDPNNPMKISDVMGDVSRLAKALYTLPQITVAVVHGAAAGLGFSLVLGCDYIIAEEDSKLAMNFIGIGLVPDGGGHFFLKERVGVPKAKNLIWSGEVMNGNEALTIGLIDEVVSIGTSSNTGDEFTEKLLNSPIEQIDACEDEPFDSKTSATRRIVYGNSDSSGSTA